MTDKNKPTDHELLEMAAKAIGGQADYSYSLGCQLIRGDVSTMITSVFWNPLLDDGDEARLEAALTLCVKWYPSGVIVGLAEFNIRNVSSFFEHYKNHGGDKQAARRLAGTRAAAAIGAAK